MLNVDPVGVPAQVSTPVATAAPAPKSKVAFGSGEKPDEFVSEVKKAKTAGTIAAVAATGSLVVSAIMLRKANAMAKVATEAGKVMEQAKAITEPLQKFSKDIGLDKALNVIGTSLKSAFEKGGEGAKGLAETLKKMNAEKDPAKLAELNKELAKGIGDVILGAAKDIDSKAAKGVGEFAKTPIAEFIQAAATGKIEKDIMFNLPDNVDKEIEKLLKEGSIAKTPEVEAFMKAREEGRAAKINDALGELTKTMTS